MNLQKTLIYFLITIFIPIFISMYYSFKYLPKLSSMDVSEFEKVNNFYSPSNDKVLNVYLRGGIVFHTDYAYVGEIQDLQNNKNHLLFLLPGEDFNVSWIDENHLMLNGKKLNINSTYDFRRD